MFRLKFDRTRRVNSRSRSSSIYLSKLKKSGRVKDGMNGRLHVSSRIYVYIHTYTGIDALTLCAITHLHRCLIFQPLNLLPSVDYTNS